MATEQVSDDVSTGLRTTRDDRSPPGLRVTWIAWDSAFRGSGLAISDRIVAVDGEALDPAGEDVKYSRYVGSISERERWKKRGAREGQRVSLTVRRGAERLEIHGELRAARSWRGDDNRPLLSPQGPDRLSNDGFVGGWGGWYDKLVESLSNVLDGSWRHRIDNRARLRMLLDEKPRVDLLIARWPGPFADILAADFAAATKYLEGRVYEVTPDDLAYRNLGAVRAAEIRAAAKAARASFLATHEAQTIPAFPAVNAMSISARETVAGKVVVLPPFGRGSQWQVGRRHWFAAGDDRQGYYFIDAHSEAMERAFAADWRYMKLIDPKQKYPHAIIGRIGPNPKMVVKDDRAHTGLHVEPIAVTIGDDAVFVDLTRRDGDLSRYAGEPEVPPLPVLSPALSPAEVLQLFFASLKRGDQATWTACFATWSVRSYGPGQIYYSPHDPPHPPALEREWVRAREAILGPVHDVRVVAVDPPELLVTPELCPGAPTVEQVVVEVDHIGLIDGVYRAYANSRLHRVWPLQRRNDGAWRIATYDQGI
ncbi:MAG TPA: hypothetical protein VNO30_01290 [Kofleriaceae bacterium]|nr:hypothetical protein [Kofleriaceae bacterium]